MKHRFTVGLVLSFSLAAATTPFPSKEADARATYRYRVEAVGFHEVEFGGAYLGNGREVVVSPRTTPFELRCESGTTIRGFVGSDGPGQQDPSTPLRFEIPSEVPREEACSGGIGTDRGFRLGWTQRRPATSDPPFARTACGAGKGEVAIATCVWERLASPPLDGRRARGWCERC